MTPNFEAIFREEFLKNAPLYVESSKVKMPYEDIHLNLTNLYRGSLHEEVREPIRVADYGLNGNEHVLVGLARDAGHVVDGLIRIENCRKKDDTDPRDTQTMRVVNIFEHADGRRNLQIGQIVRQDPNEPGWIFYRFYFAAAHIQLEYKK
jgi:hypothetical protein